MFARILASAAMAALLVTPFLLDQPQALAGSSAKPAAAPKAAPVVITGGWVREAPPGAKALGGYMTVTNQGKSPLTLVGVSSPLFESVEMHIIVEEEGRMRMKQVMSLPIGAGEQLVFKPRDQHLMLMRPKVAIKAGDQVPLELDFGPAGRVKTSVEVKRPQAR